MAGTMTRRTGNPKLLSALRLRKSVQGAEPSPTANGAPAASGSPQTGTAHVDVLNKRGASAMEATVPPAADDETGPVPVMDDAAKALHHLAQVQKRAKGALAVHAKLALHHAKKAMRSVPG